MRQTLLGFAASLSISALGFVMPMYLIGTLLDLMQNIAFVGFMLILFAWIWIEATFANHQSVQSQRERLWRVAFFVMIYIGLILSLAYFAKGTLEINLMLTLLGLLLSALGVALRYFSIRSLGKFFTYELRIDPEQRVIEEGPYRYIRHPGYAGILCLLAGLPMIFQNWYGFLWLGLVCGSFMVVRIPHEERMLIEAFGDEYRQYIKRTKRLIPFLY
jgi:protein-S-isoprenylcysteine O-methyltransferase Ste14